VTEAGRTSLRVPRFPTRTLVLMVLALLAFAWMWLQTHRTAQQQAAVEPDVPTVRATPVQLVPAGGDQ
jgi:lipopolysaccharide export system protein LptC